MANNSDTESGSEFVTLTTDSLNSHSFCGASATETCTSETFVSELNTQKRQERYADEAGDSRYKSQSKVDSAYDETPVKTETTHLRERAISETITNIRNSLQVDLCFVLDCTGSMWSYIDAAKDCILKVVEHMENTNPNIKLWFGFCGYRDHCDSERLITYDFTNSYSEFKNYVSNVRSTGGGGDGPEDVLGGLNIAVDKMNWRHRTRIILHLGDHPPHGREFDNKNDDYPDGDPNGLTTEGVLEKIKSEEILYHFGKITSYTETMIRVFSGIIGEFPVFDFSTDCKDPEVLTVKLFEAVCSSITSSVTITSIVGNVYKRTRKVLEMENSIPDWNTLPVKNGKLLHYIMPKTLADIKEKGYFKGKKNLVLRKFSYKIAPKPFSKGAERYAYRALDITNNNKSEEIVIKECVDVGRKANSLERYLEMIEVSTVAYFLSKEFNSAAKEAGIKKKVNFLKPQVLRSKDDTDTRCYSIEPKFDGLFKRFNVNTGVVKEYHSTLEAFAHFTYKYTEGYLVVYDLQGTEASSQFLLTDPAIHCKDRLRFGKTNLGNRGINECFIANHKCNIACKKLGLPKIR